MNIHVVWLIKLIVLQKCLHFQGQFFSVQFLFCTFISHALHDLQILCPYCDAFANFVGRRLLEIVVMSGKCVNILNTIVFFELSYLFLFKKCW